jgi:hypothetical protein
MGPGNVDARERIGMGRYIVNNCRAAQPSIHSGIYNEMRKVAGWMALGLVGMTAAGCGGSLVAAVYTKVSIEVDGSPTSATEMTITRRGADLDTETNPCTLTSQPDWCSRSFSQLRFNTQPSFTLYRVYVTNPSDESIVARVRIQRDGVDRRAYATVPAKSSKWFWELGTTTVALKNATE